LDFNCGEFRDILCYERVQAQTNTGLKKLKVSFVLFLIELLLFSGLSGMIGVCFYFCLLFSQRRLEVSASIGKKVIADFRNSRDALLTAIYTKRAREMVAAEKEIVVNQKAADKDRRTKFKKQQAIAIATENAVRRAEEARIASLAAGSPAMLPPVNFVDPFAIIGNSSSSKQHGTLANALEAIDRNTNANIAASASSSASTSSATAAAAAAAAAATTTTVVRRRDARGRPIDPDDFAALADLYPAGYTGPPTPSDSGTDNEGNTEMPDVHPAPARSRRQSL